MQLNKSDFDYPDHIRVQEIQNLKLNKKGGSMKDLTKSSKMIRPFGLLDDIVTA